MAKIIPFEDVPLRLMYCNFVIAHSRLRILYQFSRAMTLGKPLLA